MSQPDSIKTKIVNRVLAICRALKGATDLREIERKNALFLLTQIRPALHIVTGDESVVDEDNRGYRLKFPVAFQVIFGASADPYGAADQWECLIQQTIEDNEQLTQDDDTALVSKITYEGATPYVTEEKQPSNLLIVLYQFEYRRERARPWISY